MADLTIWVEAISRFCPDMATYLDVGAGDGCDCGFVKDAFPRATCYAIEPVEKWEVDDRVVKLRDTVAASNDARVLYVKDISGVHGIYNRAVVGTTSVQAVYARTLDHICEREAIGTVDAMKLDVEGAAWDVLTGFSGLRDLRVLHVETEWLPLFDKQHLEAEVFKILLDSGMERYWTNRVEQLGQGDSIWVRR